MATVMGGNSWVVDMRRTVGDERTVTRALPSDWRITRFSSQVPLGNSMRVVGVRVWGL